MSLNGSGLKFSMLATCEVGKAEEEGQRVGDSSMAKYLEGRKEAHCTTTRLILPCATLPTLLYNPAKIESQLPYTRVSKVVYAQRVILTLALFAEVLSLIQ